MTTKISTFALTILALATMISCSNTPSNQKENTEKGKEPVKTENVAVPDNKTIEANKEAIESFEPISQEIVDKLNKQISSKKNMSHEDIMKSYKPKSKEAKGNYQYNIAVKSTDTDIKEVTLVETGLSDDSIDGVKTVMMVKSDSNRLTVVSIKENYKCKSNRGHENWSAELCK